MKARKRKASANGIAVLIKGEATDLSATLHAVELAKRTLAVIHAVVVEPANGTKMQQRWREPLLLAAWLAQAEGVDIRFHTLPKGDDDQLLAFCRGHRIFCLIIGAGTRPAMQRKTRWVEELRRKLVDDAHCYRRSFWVLVAEPWDDSTFERIARHLHAKANGDPDLQPPEGSEAGIGTEAPQKEY
ncbi:MAG: hypothetical protein OEV91_06135 [Desulfobulbaceae bacterium]|nr:hypothetical protein [Desulfobulbaceae bacterium]